MADIVYRKANLEHAAASPANLTQGTLLLTLLTISLLAMAGPQVSVCAIYPASAVILVAYIFGVRVLSAAREHPMWNPRRTTSTRIDEVEEDTSGGSSLTGLWLRFFLLAVITGVAGYVVAESGVSISEQTGLLESVVGGLFTAVSTSLPELVTSVAAVQQGALTLAVGGIIGGNSFDVMFVAFADIAYRGGSIYHSLTQSQIFVLALAMLMTGVLLLGLLRRERRGIGNIGFESLLVLLLYGGGFLLLFFGV